MSTTIKFNRSATNVPTSLDYGTPSVSLTDGRSKLYIGNASNNAIEITDGSNIKNTPAGSIAATTVQAAINELDTEKQPTGSYITALTGDVAASGPGSASATIANSAVTNAKMANMADQTFKGNVSGGAAAPSDLTATQMRTALGTPKHNQASSAPGVGNDNTQGYSIGSQWFDTSDDTLYEATDVTTGAAVWATISGSSGSFNPTITSPAANNLLSYNSNTSTWVNDITPMKTIPSVGVSANIATVTSGTTILANCSLVASPYQIQCASDSGFSTIVHDTGYQSGTSFDFTSYLTGGNTYYVRARTKYDVNNYPTQWSATQSFTAIAATFNNAAVYFWAGSGAATLDPSSNQTNWLNGSASSAYYPMATPPVYGPNGQNWTNTQIQTVSNQNGASLGTQAISGNPSYTFTQYDAIAAYQGASQTAYIVFDLGSTKSLSAFQFKAVSSSTPGGWDAGTYTNGSKAQYWNGSAWIDIYTLSSVTNFQTINYSFSPVSFRYFRLTGATTYPQYAGTCGFRMQGN